MSRAKAVSRRNNIESDDDSDTTMPDEAEGGILADDYHDISQLELHGINAADVKKLKDAGIYTVKGLLMMTKKKLGDIKGIAEAKVDKLKEAANKIMGSTFMTAKTVEQVRKRCYKIQTGSSTLDSILSGGMESMSITEVFGEFRAGKTQLSHTLCITCQLDNPKNKYSGGKAIFIDTENTFRPARIRQIARRFEIDEDDAMENVLVCRAYSSEHQMELLVAVAEQLNENRGDFRLLIVDSVMALFRVDYSGRGELADRQQKLAQFLSRLQKISEEYNVAVFLTNQMTADPAAMGHALQMKPVGGHVLAHASTTRLFLRKGKDNTRVAKIWDSPDCAESEANYQITDGGIADC